jgi:hypothetical protein
MTPSVPTLSRVRTVVLWGLLFVWFSEMTITSVRPLSEWWTQAWKMVTPEDPQLAAALYLTHALEGAAKGALGVLALFALRSGTAFVRSALFVPMALVPPLNLAFPIREQGLQARPTMIATTLSIILWGSFFLFKEDAGTSREEGAESIEPMDAIHKLWFAANAVVLTLAAGLFLFAPQIALRLTLPCVSGLFNGSGSKPTALTLTALAVGSHLTAVATATWIATLCGRRSPIVRTAVTVANTVQAGILCVVPLTRLALDAGRDCATSSLLIYAVPLFAGWLTYDAVSYRATLSRRLRPVSTGCD